MKDLKDDPRYKLSIAMRPFVDEIYKRQFNPISIKPTDGDILDKLYSIDTVITLENGMLITVQEKVGSYLYATRKNLTIEYEQNPATHEKGDWYHMAAQVYFVGFANEALTGWMSWIMVDWIRIVIATKRGLLKWKDKNNLDGKARASFRFVFFNEIPASCILASYGL